MFSSTTVPSDSIVGEKKTPPPGVLVAYFVFLGLAVGVWHFVAEGEFSALVTLGEIFQCFALITLAMQVIMTGSIAGISARSLSLEAASLCCKLSSTLWLDGYLPNDASWDFVFQAIQLCSVLVVMWLLREVLVTRRSSYPADADTAPYIKTLVIVCIGSAVLFHGDMNDFVPFDILWMNGLLLGVVAVLPQLWFVTRTGGKVDTLTSHYIAMMAMGRVLSGIFMWYARMDITCIPWIGEFNHAIWAILSAHLLHLFLLADFAYVYVRTMFTQGLQAGLDITGVAEWV